MKRLFFALVVLVVGVVGLGFYLDWFHLSTDRADHKSNINITVDEKKMEHDKEKAKEKIKDLEHDLEHKIKEKTGPGKSGKDSPQP
jgi:hypothetical protein